jgi:hypothetical protein
MFKALALVTLGVCVTACGDGSKDPTPPTTEEVAADAKAGQTSLYLTSKSKLPACDASRKSALAYVVSEKVFYGCDGKSWAAVPIESKSEDKGLVASTEICSFTKDGLAFSYGITSLRTGESMVKCVVIDAERPYSNVFLHAKGSKNNELAACNLVYDRGASVTDGTAAAFGSYTFVTEGATKKVTYSKPGDPLDKDEFSFAASACEKKAY